MMPKNQIKKYNNLSEDQVIAKQMLKETLISCLSGNFGTGKTYLAIIYALEELNNAKYKTDIKGIVLTRPVVYEKERNLGFLPGNLWEKMGPYLDPMISIIKELEGIERTEELIKKQIVDIAPLVTIQGRTLTNKICIVDEAQNLTRNDVIDLYSRIGIGSQMIFVGSMEQCKLQNKNQSGFPRLMETAQLSKNIGHYELTSNHRSPIVEEMIKLY